MKFRNSRWTMVILGVIVLLMVGTMVWASPPAGAPSAPLQVFDAKNADKVDGLHASKKPKANTLLALNRRKKFPASVIPGAITRDKEVAAGSASIFGQTTSFSVSEMDSFTVNAPGPGTLTVIVMGSAYLDCDATSSSSRLCTNARVGICNTSASSKTCGVSYQRYDFEDPDNANSYNKEPWITLARTVNVSAAGARTFYLNGRSSTNGMTWRIQGYVIAIFSPNSLGVTSPAAPVKDEGFDNNR
jgi:hypothetical protein